MMIKCLNQSLLLDKSQTCCWF